MVLALAGFIRGAANRYSELADEERQEEKKKAARKEERDYEAKKARRDALLEARKAQVEYERKRDLKRLEQNLIQRRELAVQNVKERGQTGRVREQITGRADVAGKQIAGRADVAGKQIEGRAEIAQADREVTVDIAMVKSADAEARDKLQAQIEREKMLNALNIASQKSTNAALLRKAEAAKYQFQHLNLGESIDEDAEGMNDFVLEGSYNTEKPGLTTAGNSAQLMAELNQKLEDPAVFARVTERMRANPEFRREVLGLVNTASTDIYNRTKSVSQNGQARFRPMFHKPDMPNGVDRKGFNNIGKLPGVRERYWRMVAADSDVNANATSDGNVELRVNNDGVATVGQRPAAATNIELVTNPDIKAKLTANRIRNEDLSPETAGEFNAISEDSNMVIVALQTGASQNPTNVQLAAEKFRQTQLQGNLQDTEKVLAKSATLFSFFKSTANKSRPVAPRTQAQNMQAMMETGTASLPDPKFQKISESAKKALILGRAKYLGAQNLSRTLNKLSEIERTGRASQGMINDVRSLIEGAFGERGQLRQAAALFASQTNLSGETLFGVSATYSTARDYVFSTDLTGNADGVLAGMKQQLLRLAAYQMALTYQSASDKITDADVRRFEEMLTRNLISGDQFAGQLANFLEDSNFQLMKNYGYANTTVEDEYANVIAAQKLDALAGRLGNESARTLISGSRRGDPAATPAPQVSPENKIINGVFDANNRAATQQRRQQVLASIKAQVSNHKRLNAQGVIGAKITDNTIIELIAAQQVPNQDGVLKIRAKIQPTNSDGVPEGDPYEHLFHVRFRKDGNRLKYQVMEINSNAMGGVISSWAKTIGENK